MAGLPEGWTARVSRRCGDIVFTHTESGHDQREVPPGFADAPAEEGADAAGGDTGMSDAAESAAAAPNGAAAAFAPPFAAAGGLAGAAALFSPPPPGSGVFGSGPPPGPEDDEAADVAAAVARSLADAAQPPAPSEPAPGPDAMDGEL